MPLRLLSFEGLDGVGKTTHAQLLVSRLHSLQVDVSTYREPGGTPLGERLRELLQAGLTHSALAELLLFNTARAELVETRIKPDLDAGKLVVLDRFTDSTMAYQGALGVPPSMLEQACALGGGGLVPALTLWLDLDPHAALTRRYPLGGMGEEAAQQLDAIEQRDLDYFTRVRAGYAALAAAAPQRILRLDASLPCGEVEALVQETVSARFHLDGLQPGGAG
jgi:dTMP kinase